MSTIAAALGSVVGYLGAEVAKDSIFERLLWPQRFYNDLTPRSILKLCFLVSMGGPLHRAALETLDCFQRNGLYRGLLRGKVLGTMFYRCLPHSYIPRSNVKDKGRKKDARNCLWLEVLKHVRVGGQVQSGSTSFQRHRNEIQTIYQLTLRAATKDEPRDTLAVVQEDMVSWHTVLGILFSEISAIVVAICVGILEHYYWFTAYFCVPLIIKLLATFARVRRHPIENGDLSSYSDPESGEQRYEVFEVIDWSYGFIIIRSPDSVFRQFVRHYGHPIRDGKGEINTSEVGKDRTGTGVGRTGEASKNNTNEDVDVWSLRFDRAREIVLIITVYAFVLYFPIGLLVLVWERNVVQYIWLGYQIYLIFMMHISRLAAWDGCARTEEHIARQFQDGKTVCIQSQNGQAVVAALEITVWESVAAARIQVDKVLASYLSRSGAS